MVEEKIAEIYSEQEMRCPVHLSIGQEATAVGVCINLNKEDIKSVAKVLESHWLTQGKYVEEFESSLSSYCKVKYAISSNSATSSLILTYKALNLGKGDYLWTSANTFVATSNAIKYCEAKPIFLDVDRETLCLSHHSLAKFLKNNCEVRDDGSCWNKVSNKKGPP